MHLNFNLLECFSLLVLLVVKAESAQKKYDFCSVCRALVLEADEKIKEVDPKKTIQTGSFRVDPDGNQNIKDKQYARSNTHLEEVLESVCSGMYQYANRLFEDGSTQLVRIKGYSDEYNDDLKLDYDKGKSLKYQCEHFLEEYEEDIISYLQDKEVQDHERLICLEKTSVCSQEQLEVKLETFARPKERHEVDVESNEDNDKEEDDDEDDDSDEDNEDDATEEKDEL